MSNYERHLFRAEFCKSCDKALYASLVKLHNKQNAIEAERKKRK